jgi:hypothetical protein
MGSEADLGVYSGMHRLSRLTLGDVERSHAEKQEF